MTQKYSLQFLPSSIPCQHQVMPSPFVQPDFVAPIPQNLHLALERGLFGSRKEGRAVVVEAGLTGHSLGFLGKRGHLAGAAHVGFG